MSIGPDKNRRDLLEPHTYERVSEQNQSSNRREGRAYRHIPPAVKSEKSDGGCG